LGLLSPGGTTNSHPKKNSQAEGLARKKKIFELGSPLNLIFIFLVLILYTNGLFGMAILELIYLDSLEEEICVFYFLLYFLEK